MTQPSTSHDSHRRRLLLVIAASILALSIAAVAGVRADQATKPTQTNAKPQTPQAKGGQDIVQSEEVLAHVGEELVNKVCSTSCHGLEKLDEMRRTGREWNAQVVEMAGRGAMATEAQFTTIKKYLTRYYGLVAVNTATAEDFSAVLGLSAKDAQAIVEYRTAHGKFADVAALSKVPGIDKTKIEEQPDALRFD